MEFERWILEGLDEEVDKQGYSTRSILHVTFGPTQSDFCHFKVIMNSQNDVDGDPSRKVRQKVYSLVVSKALIIKKKDLYEYFKIWRCFNKIE
jgi:hypothetical protein